MAALLLVSAGSGAVEAQNRPQVDWQAGPTTGQLGNQAQVQVPKGYKFIPTEEAGKYLAALGNIVGGDELGVLAPEDEDWFLVFEFDDVGYVKDDEKKKLDADGMMKQMKQTDEPANAERSRRGLEPIHTVGWQRKPAYNEQTHNLEWAIRLKSNGPEFINHRTKILGRHGVMDVTWVGDTEDMSTAIAKCQTLLAGFSYKSGNKYSEFRAGDKIAKYGLTALITGGAAAVALKSGLFQKLWKVLVVAVIGIGAAVKKLFNRKATA